MSNRFLKQFMLFVTATFLVVLATQSLRAQEKYKQQILNEVKPGDAFNDKFHWGASLNIYWSTISGDQVSSSYFIKPSLGGTIRAEYYFTNVIGIGIGAGYQQRGAGINNVDKTGGAYSHPWVTDNMGNIGDIDSTHLERLRFNTLEFPVQLLLRTPKNFLQQGMRLSGAVGPTLIHTMSVNQTYQSVIDGFHPYNWVTDNYIRNEIGLQASVGVDIDSGGGKSVCQIHLVYSTGLSSVYVNNNYNGYSKTLGVRISWLF